MRKLGIQQQQQQQQQVYFDFSELQRNATQRNATQRNATQCNAMGGRAGWLAGSRDSKRIVEDDASDSLMLTQHANRIEFLHFNPKSLRTRTRTCIVTATATTHLNKDILHASLIAHVLTQAVGLAVGTRDQGVQDPDLHPHTERYPPSSQSMSSSAHPNNCPSTHLIRPIPPR